MIGLGSVQGSLTNSYYWGGSSEASPWPGALGFQLLQMLETRASRVKGRKCQTRPRPDQTNSDQTRPHQD